MVYLLLWLKVLADKSSPSAMRRDPVANSRPGPGQRLTVSFLTARKSAKSHREPAVQAFMANAAITRAIAISPGRVIDGRECYHPAESEHGQLARAVAPDRDGLCETRKLARSRAANGLSCVFASQTATVGHVRPKMPLGAWRACD